MNFHSPVVTHPVNLTTEQDARLIANGYEPVAVCGKAPVAEDWQSGDVTAERIAADRSAHPDATNTGLRCGQLVGLDIDIQDESHADRVAELAETTLGETTLARVGAKGVLLCYQNKTPVRKITIAGKGAKIEVLGTGQQFVTYGIHPDTGNPYRWVVEDDCGLGTVEPMSVPLDMVPTVTPAKLNDFATKAAALLTELGYGEARVSNAGERKPATPSASTGKRLTWEGLRTRLSYIHPQFDGTRPSCYPQPDRRHLPYGGDAWLAIALVLRDADVPLLDTDEHDWIALADEWSRGDLWRQRTGARIEVTTYPPEGIEARLGGTKRDGGSVTTVASIIEYAADGGCPLPPDDEPSRSAEKVFEDSDLTSLVPTTDLAVRPAKRSRFYPVGEEEMDAADTTRWLIPELMQEATTVLMVGETQSYKSFLALDIALAVATGRETFGVKPTMTGPTFYAALEGLSAIKGDRRRAWRIARQVEGKIEDFYVLPAPLIAVLQDCEEFGKQIAQRCNGRKPRLIVLETVNKMMAGMDENSARDAGDLIRFCDSLIAEFGCTVIAVHHKSDKVGASPIRGSSAFNANFDTVIEVSANRSARTAKVIVRKHKDAAERETPWTFKGRIVGPSLVFDPTTPAEHQEATFGHDPYSRKIVGATLRSLGAIGRENGVTTIVLAETLFPGEQNESEDDRQRRLNDVRRRLNERAKLSDGPRSLYTYAYKGEAPDGKGSLWYLPASDAA